MTILKSVLDSSITVGLKQKAPATPKLRHGNLYTCGIRRMCTTDIVNAILLQEDEQEQKYHPHTTSRGVDLIYDARRSKMTVKIRYQEFDAIDPIVLEELDIGTVPPPPPENPGEIRDDHSIQLDDIFEVHDVLYKVIRFRRNFAECKIIESDQLDYAPGSQRLFSISDVSRHIRDFNL